MLTTGSHIDAREVLGQGRLTDKSGPEDGKKNQDSQETHSDQTGAA
jgi:hypothetical protein